VKAWELPKRLFTGQMTFLLPNQSAYIIETNAACHI